MNELTPQELESMRWMDESGIVLDADLLEMANRNWRNRNERFAQEHRKGTAFDGVIFGCALSLFVWLPLIVWAWRTR